MPYATLAYNQSLALLADLYEMTMAYGYWKEGHHKKEAVFNLFFRDNPFNGGFAVACGLAYVIDFLEHFNLNESDAAYLAGLEGNDGKPLFDPGFLDYMKGLKFECDIDAVPEGTVVFPLEPLVRVRGPIIQAQILESALLNIINFQTLIATKSARIAIAAHGEPILEFGLRRAQGIDGALAASRAAYIGGSSATSNILAGKLFGIPVKGTHAHSWVMAFDDELEAFRSYARVMPNNCVFLVDTYDTLEGVKKAIQVGTWLKSEGHRMVGIRLDSGDLAYLSKQARSMLDQAGLQDARIFASNDLDEHIIQSLKEQGATVNIWGVGTKLVTGYGQPALGGVYKLSAVKDTNGPWNYKVKISEQAIKVSNPGIQQVRRYYQGKESVADVIYEEKTDMSKGCIMIDPLDMTRQKRITPDLSGEDLLAPIFRAGKKVYASPSIEDIKRNTARSLGHFHSGVKRFVNAHRYPVGIEKSLYALRTELILRTREIE